MSHCSYEQDWLNLTRSDGKWEGESLGEPKFKVRQEPSHNSQERTREILTDKPLRGSVPFGQLREIGVVNDFQR